MRVLNLYSGIRGNRKLWENVDVTAIDNNPEIAAIYRDLYPNDNMIITDAHEYLLKHFIEFDFIWASPPCPSHSAFRKNVACNITNKNEGRYANPLYPDMKLYAEIIFLQYYFKGKFAVENVRPYYTPLIKPTNIIDRHLFWTNYPLNKKKFEFHNIARGSPKEWMEHIDVNLNEYELNHRHDQIYRNCVDSDLGKFVFDSAYSIRQEQLITTFEEKSL